MGKGDIRCELSWSASRAREFERCRRETWYARYGSWGWWTERPRGERFEAMVHKNLTTLPAFAGTCVHEAIEQAFVMKRQGLELDRDGLLRSTVELFRDGWRQSSGGGWKDRPNKSVHLEEHHYGVEIPEDRTAGVRDLFERCAKTLAEAPTLEPVRRVDPKDWLALETLDTWPMEGVKVYSVPDFAFRGEDGRVRIYDWKTGRPRPEDDFQLRTYALYAEAKWGAVAEEVELYGVYLGEGTLKPVSTKAEELEETRARMRASIADMVAVHYDPDESPARLEDWPTSGAPQACGRCRFRGICPGAVEAESEGHPARTGGAEATSPGASAPVTAAQEGKEPDPKPKQDGGEAPDAPRQLDLFQ